MTSIPEDVPHDWITLHRLRFPEAISAKTRSFEAVAGPSVWRFGPLHTLGADGLPTLTSDTWCGMAIWPHRAEAEAMLDDPGAAMPWLSEAVAAWRCLAVPFSHRGKVDWRGHVEDGTAIRPAPNIPEVLWSSSPLPDSCRAIPICCPGSGCSPRASQR